MWNDSGFSMSEPGDFWTLAFFGGAVVFVLFKAWRGWRLGVVRQITSLVAFAAAWVAGIFGGGLVTPLIHAVWPGPDRAVAAIGGALLGFFVYVVITLVSMIIFKKTEHQGVGIVRFGYGFAGGILGAAYGVVLVWVAVLVVRLLGTVAETQLAVEKNPRFHQRASSKKQPHSSRVIGGLAEIKHSLEDGAVGAVVERVDPIPGTVYSTLGKIGRMVSKPASMERFSNYPGVRPLLQQPRLSALLNDPQISRAASERDYMALISNPRLLAAANDPELAAAIQRIDLDKALDYALAAPEHRAPPR